MILLLISMLALPVFLIMSVIAFMKKDNPKGKKMLKFSGISFVALFITAFGVVTTSDSTETNHKKEKVETVAKTHDDKPATVTPDEFNKLKNGMNLEEVEKIVGGKPKNPDEKENDDLILILEYDGENGIEKDSSVSLIFKDGKLNTIQQYGLIIKKETEEEKAAREANEKALAEQKAKEEAEAQAKIENAPREHKLALQKAEQYASTTQMSKSGIYDQLTSEYGEKFPADAAQFAIDNIVFDWKANALAKAEQYAIDNLK